MKKLTLLFAAVMMSLTMFANVDLYNAKTGTTAVDYYLVGYINGADYGCEGDAANMGSYKFVDGKLSAKFEKDSYVFVKTAGNTSWFMAAKYVPAAKSVTATLANTTTGTNEKIGVAANVDIEFTLTENIDGTLTLAYEQKGEVPVPKAEYALVIGTEKVDMTKNPSNDKEYMATGVAIKKDAVVKMYSYAGETEFKLDTLNSYSTENVELADGALKFKADGEYDFYFTPQENNNLIYVGEKKEDYYTVTGDQGLLGSDWGTTDKANLMTLADGVATLIKEKVMLRKGTYEYKIVKNGDTWYPEGSNNNQKLDITADGEYKLTFTFTIEGSVITGKAEKTGDYVKPADIYVIAGQQALLGAEWDATVQANQMTISTDQKTATLVKEKLMLAAGEYGYKLVLNGNWIPEGDGTEQKLKIEANAEYKVTFTVNIADTTYTATAEKTGDYVVPAVPPQFALINGNDTLDMVKNDKAEGEEYMLLGAELKKDDIIKAYSYAGNTVFALKVLKEGSDENVTMLEDGTLKIGADGKYDFYLAPAENNDAIYVSKQGSPTALDNVEALLDLNAPIYNLMGQQVTAAYKGVVIQNGTKYMLR